MLHWSALDLRQFASASAFFSTPPLLPSFPSSSRSSRVGDRLHPTDDEATTIHVPLIPEFDIPFDGSGNGRRMGRMDGGKGENRNLRKRTRQIGDEERGARRMEWQMAIYGIIHGTT